tara:strand:- start:2367 stop:2570 length:204 start_codon:yes stop_codon:yes gene_type:complete
MQDTSAEDGSSQDIMLRHTKRYCCRMLLISTDNLCALLSNANFTAPSERAMMEMTTRIPHSRKVVTD